MKLGKLKGHLFAGLCATFLSANVLADEMQWQPKYGVELSAAYAIDHEAQGLKFELDMLPVPESGLKLSIGIDQYNSLQYNLNDTALDHNLSTFRYGIGYKWQLIPSLMVSTTVGGRAALSDEDDSFVDNGETSTYLEVGVEYEVFDSFNLVSSLSHDIGHTDLNGAALFGLGMKYTFGKTPRYVGSKMAEADEMTAEQKQQMMSESDQAVMAMNDEMQQGQVDSQAQGVELMNTAEMAAEQLNSQQMLVAPLVPVSAMDAVSDPSATTMTEQVQFVPYYTVQIGSFNREGSVSGFLNSSRVAKSETFTRNVNGKIKLYKGEFSSKSQAQSEANRLRQRGVTGFVVYVDSAL